jgi:uncharacterized protein YprB with RNaseH-like and TPR domain
VDLLLSGAADARVPTGRLVFLDLETTGLAGGAGTYAFLVGCGWFDGGVFRIRQFFLSGMAGERSVLDEVAATIGGSAALVTYNGKTFDLPLIETRFLFHRMTPPSPGRPHIDLLHPARRLWAPAARGTEPADVERQSCRLSVIERQVLGHAREGDVPGFEIPARYFNYVRSGDARPLEPVLEHNRLDLLALAMLTARAAQLLDEGAPGARTAREALGLGRLYERGGLASDARACFARACELDGDHLTRAEALRTYGMVCRRERRYLDAAEAWRRVLALRGCPARIAREATEALAVHHEHRVRDLRAARQFAVQALQFHAGTTRVHAVHHRLARIDRKLGSIEPAPLF